MHPFRLLVTLAVAAIAVVAEPALTPRTAGAAAQTAVPRLRVGLDANPKTDSRYEHKDWEESIGLMQTTPATQFHFAKVWVEIERTPGNYDLGDVEFMVSESAPLAIAFNLRVLDAGSRNMPEAYKGLAWDSPEMVAHVVAVIEKVAPALGRRVWSYAVGNEIDLYFGSRPGEVGPYARMLATVRQRVRELHPDARFTTSFQSTAAPQLRTTYAPIVAQLDHVAFTYYPLGADFRVRPPSSVTADLATMIAAAQPRPILLQEIGYPSDPLLGSSQELQSTFVRLAFEAVRAAGTDRVLGATYLFQSDFPEWLVDQVVRAYGAESPTFRAFIRSLGLRDERNREKQGWAEFVRQAEVTAPKRRDR